MQQNHVQQDQGSQKGCQGMLLINLNFFSGILQGESIANFM
jgi:hypothetical protein